MISFIYSGLAFLLIRGNYNSVCIIFCSICLFVVSFQESVFFFLLCLDSCSDGWSADRMQGVMAIRFIRGYRTISGEAANLLAGMPPWDLEVQALADV